MQLLYRSIGMYGGLLLALGILIMTSGCNSEPEADSFVNGQFRHGKGYWLFLDELDAKTTLTLDSVQLDENGHFSFPIHMEATAQFYFLRLQSGERIRILLQKGENAELTANALHLNKTYVVSNSPGSRKLWELSKLTEANYTYRDSVYMYYRKNPEGLEQKELNARTDSVFRMLYKKHYEEVLGFVKDNDSSLAAIFGLYASFDDQPVLDFNYDFESYRSVAEKLITRYPDNVHAIALNNRILEKDREEAYGKERELALSPGKVFPALRLPDMKGQEVDVRSIEAELLVLSFWKSTVSESWNVNAKLKELEKAYPDDQLQLVSIGLEDDKLAWKNTIALDQLDRWQNLLGTPETVKDFNLQTLPRVFLLDARKKILYNNIPADSLAPYIDRILD